LAALVAAAVAVAVAIIVFVLVSGGGDDDEELDETMVTPAPEGDASLSPSPEVPGPARLVWVGAAPHGESEEQFPNADWVVFQFEGGSPTRSVRWLDEAPSGVDGVAFLEVSFSGATASEPSTGEATCDYPPLSGLQVVADLEPTMDDGGNLVLVIGVSQKTDYVDLSPDASTSAVIVQWSPGPDSEAPHAAPIYLDQGVELLGEGLEEITLAPGDSHSIDSSLLAEDWGVIPPPCADYVFYLSWQVRRPFPPDGVEIQVHSNEQAGRELLGEWLWGVVSAGCGLLEIVNTGTVEITIELRYVFASYGG